MDIFDYINRGGLKEVQNPLYNPKSKKNIQPKTILVEDYNPDKDKVVSIAREAILNETSTSAEEADKYGEYGINWNAREAATGDLDRELARKQSNAEKFWNATVQGVVNEVGIGSLKGFTDIADFFLSKVFHAKDDDYTNPLSKMFADWQDYVEQKNPIYVDPDKQTIAEGGLGDAGWWASNLPSVLSTVSLMIPGKGVSAALSIPFKFAKVNRGVRWLREAATGINKADKLANAAAKGAKLNAFENAFMKTSRFLNDQATLNYANRALEAGVSGMAMRIAENYQESQQTYEDVYGEAKNVFMGMSDEEYDAWVKKNSPKLQDYEGDIRDKNAVAKHIAKAAADVTFRDDMINGIFDVYQMFTLPSLTKGFMNLPSRAATRAAQRNSIKWANKTASEVEDLIAKRSSFQKGFDKVFGAITGDKNAAFANLGDVFVGAKHAIGSELSEGIEEAVNYIAQEEGKHYGGYLLDTVDEGSRFDDRLVRYVNNPQLWDAAFWGVLGGITFEGVGGKISEVANNATKMIEDAQKKKGLKEQEKINTDFFDLFTNNELTTRLDDIRGRVAAKDKLYANLKSIEEGKNPFVPADAQKEVSKITSEEEKQILRNRAYSDFTANLLKASMFAGNYDLTKAFLESDEFKQSLVEMGGMSQQEADTRQREAMATAATMETLFTNNLRAIGNAVRGMADERYNEETGARYGDLAYDYLRLIAADNIDHQLLADRYQRELETFTPLITSEQERLKDALSSFSISPESAVRTFVLAQQLGQVQAQLEEMEKAKEGGSLSAQRSIDELNHKKYVIQDLLNKSTTGNTLSDKAIAYVAARAAATTTFDKKTGKYNIDLESEKFKELDRLVMEATSEDMGDADRERAFEELKSKHSVFNDITSLAELNDVVHQSKVVDEAIQQSLGDESPILTLNELSVPLLTAYASRAYAEINRAEELSKIAISRSDIMRKVDELHNGFTQLARYAVTEGALNTLKRIAKKYNEQFKEKASQRQLNEGVTLGELLIDYGLKQTDSNFADTAREMLEELLSDEDLSTLQSTLDLLNLANIHNSHLVTNARNALIVSESNDYNDIIEIKEEEKKEEKKEEETAPEEEESTEDEAKDKEEKGESSSTSEKRTEEPKKDKVIPTPPPAPKNDRRTKSEQNEPFLFSKKNTAGNKVRYRFPRVNIISSDGKPVSLDNVDNSREDLPAVPIKRNPDANNQVELDFITQLEDASPDATAEDNAEIATLQNEELFDREDGVSLLDTDVEVTQNPVVYLADDGKTIISIDKGKIAKVAKDESETSGEPGEPGEEAAPETDEENPAPRDRGRGRVRRERSISPTGENDETSDDEDDNIDTPYDLEEINTQIQGEIMELYDEDNAIEDEDVLNYVKNYLNDTYGEGTIINQDLDAINEQALRSLNKERGRNNKKGRGARRALRDIVRSSAIIDSQFSSDERRDQATAILTESLDKVLQFYLDNIPFSDGNTKVISLEGLMRYVKDVSGDIRMASYMYDRFVAHLQSKRRARGTKYRIIDSGSSRQTIMDNVSKTVSERITELVNPNGRSIGLNVTLRRNITDESKLNEIYQILATVKPDDDVTVSPDRNSEDGHITGLVFKVKGVELGRIPTPFISGNTLTHYTDGWKFKITANDGSMSELQAFYLDLLNNPDNGKLIQLIANAAILTKYKDGKVGKYTDEYAAICKEIFDEIERLYPGIYTNEDLVSKSNPDRVKLAHGVVQVLQYMRAIANNITRTNYNTEEEYQAAVTQAYETSVNNWFGKLRDSLETAAVLVHDLDSGNPSIKVKVEDITGNNELVGVTADKARPIQENGVIGSSHKGKVQLIMGDITQSGVAYTSTGKLTGYSMPAGRTLIGIPDRNGKLIFANAFPQRVWSKQNFKGNKDIARLRREILKEMNRVFDAWFTDVYASNEDLFDFFTKLVSRYGGNEALFRGFQVYKMTGANKGNGFYIKYKDETGETKYINFYDIAGGYQVSNVSMGKERGLNYPKKNRTLAEENRTKVKEALKNLIEEHLTFNVQQDLLRSDYDGTSIFNNDMVYRDVDGKFYIKIGNAAPHVYDSYTDFIIGSNAINVATESRDGVTNFKRKFQDNDQYDSTMVTYKLVTPTTPVKERTTSAPATPSSDTNAEKESVSDVMRSIIEKNGKGDISQQIISTLLNDTQLGVLNKSALLKQIPLSNIVIHDGLSDIARCYLKDGVLQGKKIKAGTIVVGKRFFNMLNSGNTSDREQAFRHLLHEAVHRYINFNINSEKRKQLFDEIKEIFSTFVNANERDGISGFIREFEFNTTKDRQRRYYTNGEINERGLEEFLVESITRPQLMQRLNEISANGKEVKSRNNKLNIKSKNLFQKILAVISELFGVKANKNSLLEREYNLFKTVFDNVGQNTIFDNATNGTSEEVVQKVEEKPETTQEPKVEEKAPVEEQKTTSDDDVSDDDLDMVMSDIADNTFSTPQSILNKIIPQQQRKFETLVNNGDIELICKL